MSTLKVFVSVLILLPYFLQCTPLNIIGRSKWGARFPKNPPLRATQTPVPYIVIHHTQTPSCGTEEKCIARVKQIQSYHMDDRKWDDIGYNFLIDGDGNVYEGRGWGIRGAHSIKYNGRSVGIALIGTFSDKPPSDKQIKALQELISYGVSKEEIKSDYNVIGHRQGSKTDCPGNALFSVITKWQHWQAEPKPYV